MFSFNKNDSEFRAINDKEIIVVFIQAGNFIANDSNIINKLKPVLVQYDLITNSFISVESTLPVIPFLSVYNFPSWGLFDQPNIFYRNNLIENFRSYGKAAFNR